MLASIQETDLFQPTGGFGMTSTRRGSLRGELYGLYIEPTASKVRPIPSSLRLGQPRDPRAGMGWGGGGGPLVHCLAACTPPPISRPTKLTPPSDPFCDLSDPIEC